MSKDLLILLKYAAITFRIQVHTKQQFVNSDCLEPKANHISSENEQREIITQTKELSPLPIVL